MIDVDIRHPTFNQVAGASLALERMATGFAFTEGPVWHPDGQYLIFSDFIYNILYRWRDGAGVPFFRRSGYLVIFHCDGQPVPDPGQDAWPEGFIGRN